MSDDMDWEKRYWANKARERTTGKSQERLPAGIRPVALPDGYTNSRNGEVDVSSMMAQRVASQVGGGTAPGGRSCTLKEGYPYYSKVQTGEFGSTAVLVRSVGTLNGISGRTFEVLSEVNAYVIDNLPTVDLSTLPQQSHLSKELVAVRAPFIGNIMVPRDAIMESLTTNAVGVVSYGGKRMLKG